MCTTKVLNGLTRSVQKLINLFNIPAQGINPHDIYFANTSKVASHMKSAMANDVDLMAFDSLRELHKIQKSCPKARLLLSLQNGDWQELLVKAKDLNLQVIGVILPKIEGPFCKMMAWTRMAFAIGRSLGHEMSIGMYLLLESNLTYILFIFD